MTHVTRVTCLILHHLLNRLQSTPYSLQHTAATLQRAATRCNALQHTRVTCLVPHHPLYTQVTANSKFTATHCNSTATHCNTLQHHCNTVQCTATHACDMPHLALLSQHTGHGQLQIRFSTLQQHYNALQHTATHTQVTASPEAGSELVLSAHGLLLRGAIDAGRVEVGSGSRGSVTNEGVVSISGTVDEIEVSVCVVWVCRV